MQRLWRNIGRYLGEQIDIQAAQRDIDDAAVGGGWKKDRIPVSNSITLPAYLRLSSSERRRLYLSTGIHGDEPAGPLAVLELLKENNWPGHVSIWLCPCLNPTGFIKNTRENADGIDLNRQYLQPQAHEVRAHMAWLNQQPDFDLALCLHEDWESHGFYLYELNPENLPSFSQAIIKKVSRVCPIDPSPQIEGLPAKGGIIRPSTDPRSRPQWPEAFYLITQKTRLSYTLEAPSDFTLSTRVSALVEGVKAALDHLS